MNVSKELEQVLLQVQKPARSTGGELNSVVKRPRRRQDSVCLLFFPICTRWACPIWE